MNYEIINDYGELEIEFKNIRGHGSRVSRDFLRELLKHIVERATKYYDETGDHVFTYTEMQLHSIVCPSIAEITSSYLMEHPLTRKPTDEEEYRGKVDYWIHYRNYSYLMELKHTYFAFRRADNPRKKITTKFLSALEQLDNIRKKECRDLKIDKGLMKITLETVVFYRGAKEKETLTVNIEGRNFRTLFKKLVNNTVLEQRSNLRALWVLDKRLVEPFEYAKSFVIYPAVAFIGKISELIE